MDAFWPVLASIASALLLPIAAAVGLLLTKRIQLAAANTSIAKLKLTGDRGEQIKFVCNMAVSAAQQLYNAKKITDRKQYAMDMVTKILVSRKIEIEQDIISAYIEAEVLFLSDDSNTTTTTTTSPSDNTGGSTTTTITNPSDNIGGSTTTTTNTNPTTPVANTDTNTNTTTPVGLG